MRGGRKRGRGGREEGRERVGGREGGREEGGREEGGREGGREGGGTYPSWHRVTRALDGRCNIFCSSSASLKAAALTRRALLRPILRDMWEQTQFLKSRKTG